MSSEQAFNRPLIGISACLLGERVRYDGGHKQHSFICSSLGDYFDFKSFCPEMEIGLGVPRPTIRLVDHEGEIRCSQSKDSRVDVTEKLKQTAHEQFSWIEGLAGYIVKKGSPSCGMERVKVHFIDEEGQTHRTENNGIGLFTEQLLQHFPHLPVEEEGRLGDAVIRENFIARVLIYQRWRDMASEGLSLNALMTFHATLKYTLFSHDQQQARDLGRALSQCTQAQLETFIPEYLQSLMRILTIKATRKNHVNVLQHIQGYLKPYLSADDKAEMQEIITQYHQGLVPLIVPITLLRHYFRQYPNEYIAKSSYLYPHPNELMLLNRL